MSSQGGSTVVSRGVSLNFDADALVYDDEAELQREEQQQQHELRQLLTEAFDDLSEEDDNESNSSIQDNQTDRATPAPQEITQTIEEVVPSDHIQQQHDMKWPSDHVLPHHIQTSQQTSTPKLGQPPPLATPVTTAKYQAPLNPSGQRKAQQSLTYGPRTDTKDQLPVGLGGPPALSEPLPPPTHPTVTSVRYGHAAEGAHPLYERGQTEGGNEIHDKYEVDITNDTNGYYTTTQIDGNNIPPYTQPPPLYANGYVDNHEGNQYMTVSNNIYQSDIHGPLSDQYSNQEAAVYTHDNVMSGPDTNHFHAYNDQQMAPASYGTVVPATQFTYPLSPPRRLIPEEQPAPQESQNSLDNYKVQYVKSKSPTIEVERRKDENEAEFLTGKDPAIMPRPTTPGGESDEVNPEFFKQVGETVEGQQLAQLRILYEARGRRLDELDQEYKVYKDDTNREIRILKHRLALSEDERSGMSGSLENSKDLLRESKEKENRLEGQVTALNAQVQSLTTAKEEIVRKLETAESTIENLNAQLLELECSESLTRARQQHESIVGGMQQKYDKQILILKEKIDELNRTGQEKDDEVTKLKKQISNMIKCNEEANISRADSINRLTRSLEDSQKQCRELLEAGTGHEVSKLKMQLQDVIAGKSIAEDINVALQSEIGELKEQITMYESASQFGVFSTSGSITSSNNKIELEDSYAQLNIKKASTEHHNTELHTPRSARSEPGANMSADETLTGLKCELERCLMNYKTKRLQVEQLQQELKSAKLELETVKGRLEEAGNTAKDAKV